MQRLYKVRLSLLVAAPDASTAEAIVKSATSTFDELIQTAQHNRYGVREVRINFPVLADLIITQGVHPALRKHMPED